MSKMKTSEFKIREAVPEDLVSVLPLIERFVEFGPPAWRGLDRGRSAR
jgi:hypothetical protein